MNPYYTEGFKSSARIGGSNGNFGEISVIFLNNLYSFPGRLQASSHNFLSAIFGILGKFGIGIGNPKISGRKIVRRKKIRTLLVENFVDRNFC